ncbi:hypothetical protein R3I94_001996 [Phoxinus phoxinus]
MIGAVLLSVVCARPAQMPDQYARGVDWLIRYGYFPSPDSLLGRLHTPGRVLKKLSVKCSDLLVLKRLANLVTNDLRIHRRFSSGSHPPSYRLRIADGQQVNRRFAAVISKAAFSRPAGGKRYYISGGPCISHLGLQ